MKKFETFFIVITFIILFIAWFLGDVLEERKLEGLIQNSLTQTENIKKTNKGIYFSKKRGIAIAITTSPGYGGPLRVATSVDKNGDISKISIISNKETVPFFNKIVEAKYPEKLLGKNYSKNFIIGEDVDIVSGATFSLRALTSAVRKGAIKAAVDGFSLKKVSLPESRLNFGFKELLLILLFITGFLNYLKLIGIKTKKYLRWSSMFLGMIFLGFVYTVPLSIININSFIMGFWPDWNYHIFWYLLLLGVFLPLILIGKNPYCDSFCPFGATQEILKKIGGSKKKIPLKLKKILGVLQKVLAFGIVILALLFRDPGYGNYEVFGTCFTLTGNNIQYVLMAVIVILSLFFTRPWCNYLCPIRAVSDLIIIIRKKRL